MRRNCSLAVAHSRGQTEPLAALAAVFAIGVGLTLYAGFVSEHYPGTSDRDVADVTLERVWNDVGSDGLFDERTDDLTEPPEGLPNGHTVHVEVTVRDGDDLETVAELFVGTDGNSRPEPPDPPADAHSATRPIGIQLADAPGDVRTGTLRVEVWSR